MTTRHSSYAKRTHPPGPRQRSHDRTLLTPAQTAFYLGSSVEWVIILADAGHFPGACRIPHKRGSGGSQPGHRRIPVRAVLAYLTAKGLPLPAHLVTAVTAPVAVAYGVPPVNYRFLAGDRFRLAGDPATFGWLMATERPRVVVIGPELTTDAYADCLGLVRTKHHHAVRIVCHPADRRITPRHDEIDYPYPTPWAVVVGRVNAVLDVQPQPEEKTCPLTHTRTLTTTTTTTKTRSH